MVRSPFLVSKFIPRCPRVIEIEMKVIAPVNKFDEFDDLASKEKELWVAAASLSTPYAHEDILGALLYIKHKGDMKAFIYSMKDSFITMERIIYKAKTYDGMPFMMLGSKEAPHLVREYIHAYRAWINSRRGL